MRKVVVLRPNPGADSSLNALKQAGVDAVWVPLFEVRRHDWKAPDPSGFDGILLTSANALAFAGDELKKLLQLPVYAVGPATAKFARSMGFKVAKFGNAGITRFLKQIPHDLKLVHLVGEDRLEYRLVWQKVEPITVYSSERVEKVDEGQLDGNVVMVHSPRAGKALAEIAKDKGSISVVAISKQAAAACGTGWKDLIHSEEPNDAEMVTLAAKLCDKPAKE
jgi:uroporphyrinogen-III synthase